MLATELAIAFEETALDAQALRAMQAAAAFHARRAARMLKLAAPDHADLEQEILVVLMERRRSYEPTKGAWATFAGVIAGHAAHDLVQQRIAARRHRLVSIDDLVDASDTDTSSRVGDVLCDGRLPSESDMLDAMSIEAFVRRLPADLRLVAQAALEADGDLGEAHRASGLSNSEFYRRLREVRYRMFTVGLVNRRRLAAAAAA
jgi:hypothetical protein